MISEILQHLDALQTELSAIDPTQDFAAADKVADIASALRQALDGAAGSGRFGKRAEPEIAARRAA